MNNKKNQLYENRKTVERFQKIAGLLKESFASHNIDDLEDKKRQDVEYYVANGLGIDEEEAWKIVHNMIDDDINGDPKAKQLFSNMSTTAEEVADYIVNKER